MFRFATRGRHHPHRRRTWLVLLALVGVLAAVTIVLSLEPPASSSTQISPPDSQASATNPSPETSDPVTSSSVPIQTQLENKVTAPPNDGPVSAGQPATVDFRQLALAAATAVYSWDSRKATYSQTYASLRSWWHVLSDNSNPLTVFATQFEATGINAGSYASLSGTQGYRTAAPTTASCDSQLSQFAQYPPPWAGMHVCTVTVAVVEHATSGTNKYTAPVSVIVNCPPARTAPAYRCEMVAFYAAPDRIVY